MVIYKEQLVQRGLNFAVIDEVDSVLIDEARTPLIISGQSNKSTKLYEACDILARQLERGEASGEFSKINAIDVYKRQEWISFRECRIRIRCFHRWKRVMQRQT